MFIKGMLPTTRTYQDQVFVTNSSKTYNQISLTLHSRFSGVKKLIVWSIHFFAAIASLEVHKDIVRWQMDDVWPSKFTKVASLRSSRLVKLLCRCRTYVFMKRRKVFILKHNFYSSNSYSFPNMAKIWLKYRSLLETEVLLEVDLNIQNENCLQSIAFWGDALELL